jgi:hypothetical protein
MEHYNCTLSTAFEVHTVDPLTIKDSMLTTTLYLQFLNARTADAIAINQKR